MDFGFHGVPPQQPRASTWFSVAPLRRHRRQRCHCHTAHTAVRQVFLDADPSRHPRRGPCARASCPFPSTHWRTPTAFNRRGALLRLSGHEAADLPVCEDYLNNPRDTAPADLLTDIYLPLVG